MKITLNARGQVKTDDRIIGRWFDAPGPIGRARVYVAKLDDGTELRAMRLRGSNSLATKLEVKLLLHPV